MGYCVCIGGIPGVGKTLLGQSYVRQYGAGDRSLSGSSVLKRLIAPSHVREFDGWAEERRIEVRERAAGYLAEERDRTPGRLLVDGHFTLRNRVTDVIEPVFTPADRTLYAGLALVDGTPEQVVLWRTRASARRAQEPRQSIAQHLAAEHAEGARLAHEMSVPFLVIDSGDLPEWIHQLREFLNESFPTKTE
jgi:adenylate kinase